jgi:Domain of Unknown Function (DUF928)
MHSRHSSPYRLAASLLLSLVIVGGATLQVTYAQEYNPPDRGLPGRREGGGTRGNCVHGDTPLVALIPETNFGTTLEPYPTFYWSIPQMPAATAEFVLLDENDDEVYKNTIQLAGPGIVSLSVPNDGSVAPLERGKDYHWYFSVVCDARDRSGDIFAEGWIQRIAPPAGLTNQLAAAAVSDRPTIFANAGIWYDALTTLAKLRQADPENPQLSSKWANLLRSVGLENLAGQPLVSCCVPMSSADIAQPDQAIAP